ncbi:MAG: Holliday junction resolvase RuvX [Pirellulales bacterium]|nr:Holliday junction resolvase RuvX [Pirellulales bacterium]
MTAELPTSDTEPGRVAAIDYGTVRIGIAITDRRRTLASPLETYTRVSRQADAARFVRLVKEEGVRLFVVGLPVHLDGHESAKSREATAFGRWLHETTSVPVEFFDERYSTTFATEQLAPAGFTKKRQKKRLDAVAAQVLLTAWLEAPPHERARVATPTASTDLKPLDDR